MLLMWLVNGGFVAAPAEEIQWETIEAASLAAPQDGKKLLVDLYTDWCGWCKVMDRETYSDPRVVKYINEHFHPVKFDAEQKGKINVGGETFDYIAGRRIHSLALSMFGENRPSYPTTVFFEKNLEIITQAPGYIEADEMLMILHFLGSDSYKKMSWSDFSSTYKPE